jgi:hypothetical protein
VGTVSTFGITHLGWNAHGCWLLKAEQANLADRLSATDAVKTRPEPRGTKDLVEDEPFVIKWKGAQLTAGAFLQHG